MTKQFTLFAILVLCLFFVQIANAQSIICVDAGHGGSDAGAVGNGLYEKNINLDVSNRLYTLLKNAGYKPYLTRSNDSDVSLSSRTSYANSIGAHRFISIHCNAFNGSANGTETFCYTEGSSTSFSMRDHVNPLVVQAMGTYNRGCKTANYYVIKYTNMPAILCELAFIDHAGDAAKLGNATYRQKAAEAVKSGFEASRSGTLSESTMQNFYIAPRWSPDGSKLLVSNPSYNGIYIIDISKKNLQAINHWRRVGYKAKWTPGGDIQYIEKGAPVVVTCEGVRSNAEPTREEITVEALEGEIYVDGKVLTKGEDTFFSPILSPNKKMVAFEGICSGIHVCDISGENHVVLGKGNNPAWTPDSGKIIFDVSEDNGSDITGSDIWMVSLNNPTKRINMTGRQSSLSQRPCVSPDGTKVAFDANGKIFTADLAENSLKNFAEVEISK